LSLLRPLDPAFPIERQFGIDTGPVVLVKYSRSIKAGEQSSQIWQDNAAFMKRQPGFISTQLHRAIGKTHFQP